MSENQFCNPLLIFNWPIFLGCSAKSYLFKNQWNTKTGWGNVSNTVEMLQWQGSGFTMIGLETVLQRFMSMVMACTHPSDLLHKFDGVFILRWVLVEVGLQAIPECFVDDLLYSLLQTRRKKRKKVWKIWVAITTELNYLFPSGHEPHRLNPTYRLTTRHIFTFFFHIQVQISNGWERRAFSTPQWQQTI